MKYLVFSKTDVDDLLSKAKRSKAIHLAELEDFLKLGKEIVKTAKVEKPKKTKKTARDFTFKIEDFEYDYGK